MQCCLRKAIRPHNLPASAIDIYFELYPGAYYREIVKYLTIIKFVTLANIKEADSDYILGFLSAFTSRIFRTGYTVNRANNTLTVLSHAHPEPVARIRI